MSIAISSAINYTNAKAVASTRGAMTKYMVLAGLAAAADLISKFIATSFLGDGSVERISQKLSLMLVYNTGGAGGVTVGPYTVAINILVTIVAIVMVARIVGPLAAVDSRAVSALGLVTGGAFGNLASMLAGPKGVADFLAVEISSTTTVVMNVADLFLWTGALMLIPVVVRLVNAVMAERRTR